MRTRTTFLLLYVALTTVGAQDLAYRMAASDYHLNYDQTRTLFFELDNISFFKDNEFEGQQSKGYSLPGLWLQPKLTYQPLDAIRLEAGLHALIFDGANKYLGSNPNGITYPKIKKDRVTFRPPCLFYVKL